MHLTQMLTLTSCSFSILHVKSVKPIWGRTKDIDEHMGWIFPSSSTEEPGAEPDPLSGAKSIRELYELASSNYVGKYTVPVCTLYTDPYSLIPINCFRIFFFS